MTFVALTALLVLGQSNAPFVRSHTRANDASSPCLWWATTPITFVQSDAGNSVTTGDTEFGAITGSFETWNIAGRDCSSMRFVESPRTTSRAVGFDASGQNNTNIVLFRERLCTDVVETSNPCWRAQTCGNDYDCWFYSTDVIALTTTTFDSNTGRVYDGDIELNAGRFYFTTTTGDTCSAASPSQACVSTDVQNTMTHEIGHLIGLDHTQALGSTMNPSADLGDTNKRRVDSGTLDYLCNAYPVGKAPRACSATEIFVPVPCSTYRSGDAPAECGGSAGGDDDSGGCSAAAGAWALIPGLLVLGASAFLRRRA